jgi:hypothetical protein
VASLITAMHFLLLIEKNEKKILFNYISYLL